MLSRWSLDTVLKIEERVLKARQTDRQTDIVSLPFHSALVQISSEKTTLILVFLWSDFYVVKMHTGKCQ